MNFEPRNPKFEEETRASFAQQGVMQLIGASLSKVAPGEVQIRLPFRTDLTQQDGFLHAGVVTTILDSSCGYAAYSLMPPGSRVLTVEFKINFIAPARGEQFIATGKVAKRGVTLTICQGEVTAIHGGNPTLVAIMMATMIRR